MLKKILFLAFALFLVFQGTALALEGEVIFRDGLYGAAIGVLIGVGAYAISGEDAGANIGGGLVLGTAVGVGVGIVESSGAIRIGGGSVSVGIPIPHVAKVGTETRIEASLLDMAF